MRALYATCDILKHGKPSGETITFRIGLPGSARVIDARHQRFDRAHWNNGRRLTVVHGGRSYPVRRSGLEIRYVDSNGRGIGSDRHWTARPVKVSALMIERDLPHTIQTYVNRAWRQTGVWGATVTTNGRGAFIGHGATPLAAQGAARKRARFASAI